MNNQKMLRVGFGWFRRTDWDRLKSISTDEMHDTYDDWLVAAEGHLVELRKQGFEVAKVAVEPEELLRWAKANNVKIDPKGRANFAAWKLQKQSE